MLLLMLLLRLIFDSTSGSSTPEFFNSQSAINFSLAFAGLTYGPFSLRKSAGRTLSRPCASAKDAAAMKTETVHAQYHLGFIMKQEPKI